MIDRSCAVAAELILRIGALPGATALCPPLINQGMVRFFDPRPNASEADHDRLTDAVVVGIRASGEAFFTPTTWHGMRAMRISVSNWQTSLEDVAPVATCVARVLDAERTRVSS
jgi:glutamate/tyrosine decarboxylase-like PLP-dependent enzyme